MPVDAFIKFTGNKIQVAGESQDSTLSGAKGWSSIKSVTFSTEHAASIGTATLGASGGKADFKDFTIEKEVDIASPSLFLALCSGDTFKEVDIVIRKAVGGTEAAGALGYLQYSFYLVFVTKIDLNLGDGDEAPKETITFAYGATQIQYQQQKIDGSMSGSPKIQQWSRISNKADLSVGTLS